MTWCRAPSSGSGSAGCSPATSTPASTGLVAGGATEVLVNEAHSSQRNLLLEELDERATHAHRPAQAAVDDAGHRLAAWTAWCSSATTPAPGRRRARAHLPGELDHRGVAGRRAGERGRAQRGAGRRARGAGAAGHRRRPRCVDAGGLRAGRAGGRGEGVRQPLRRDLPAAAAAPPDASAAGARARDGRAGRRPRPGTAPHRGRVRRHAPGATPRPSCRRCEQVGRAHGWASTRRP